MTDSRLKVVIECDECKRKYHPWYFSIYHTCSIHHFCSRKCFSRWVKKHPKYQELKEYKEIKDKVCNKIFKEYYGKEL
jgi:hypothetical protein